MSLLSQKDRDLVIYALEHLRDDSLRKQEAFETLGVTDVKLNDNLMMELNALINWIKLEKSKHEN